MTKVEINIEIKRPAEEVFAFISNFENNPRWQSGMQEAHFTSQGPLAIGSTYVQVAKFLGRRIASTFEVIDCQPGRMVKAKTISSSFPIQFRRSVEPIEGGSRVSAIIEGDASGFFKLFTPFLNWLVRRSIEGDYANLKRLLENKLVE